MNKTPRSHRLAGGAAACAGGEQGDHHVGNRHRTNPRREPGGWRAPDPEWKRLFLRRRLARHGAGGRFARPQRRCRKAHLGVPAARKFGTNRGRQRRQLGALRERRTERGDQHPHALPRRAAVDPREPAARRVQRPTECRNIQILERPTAAIQLEVLAQPTTGGLGRGCRRQLPGRRWFQGPSDQP